MFMHRILFIGVFLIGLTAVGCMSQQAEGQKSPQPRTAVPEAERIPVIVELYTSEGCSSCPPADRALKFLAEQQPVPNALVIPLAFHVDYWNNLGWKDEFSSPLFSRRQELYIRQFGLDSSYTPEMVVDGQAEFIGNDTGRAAKAITAAAAREKGSITVSFDSDAIVIAGSKLPKHDTATVFLAVVEDNITSNVKAGENAGQTFNHSSVVRSLTPLGVVEKNSVDFQLKTSTPAAALGNKENQQTVLFVQDNNDRRILAVQVIGARRVA
jgi:hypothetical protein